MNAVRTQPSFSCSAAKNPNDRFMRWLGIWFVIVGELLAGTAVAGLVLENARTVSFLTRPPAALPNWRLQNGERLPGSRSASPLLEMQHWDRDKGAVVPLPGGPPDFHGATRSRHGIRQTLRLAYTLAEGRIAADCEISLEPDGSSRWQVRVRNDSPFPS